MARERFLKIQNPGTGSEASTEGFERLLCIPVYLASVSGEFSATLPGETVACWGLLGQRSQVGGIPVQLAIAIRQRSVP